MDLIQIIVLGIVQGLTEFLPISSSGHLILTPLVFGWSDQGLAFDISVHLGTLCAVLWYFRDKILSISEAWLGQFVGHGVTNESKLGWYIIIATIPICIAGLLFGDFVEHNLRSAKVIAFTTIFWGIILWLSDKYGKKYLDLSKLTFVSALFVGIAQCLAMVPGTSRSGITMTAGLFLGLTRIAAAEFSFLLSVPTIFLAGAFKLLELFRHDGPVNWADLGIGALVSGIVAYFCISLFMRFITRIGLFPFMIYRIFLGIVIILFLI
jgi:undecaprenyl-diphosphatase